MKFQTFPGWVPHKCLKGSHPEKNYKCLSVSTRRIGSAQPVSERFKHCFKDGYINEAFSGLPKCINNQHNCTEVPDQPGEKKENKFQFSW